MNKNELTGIIKQICQTCARDSSVFYIASTKSNTNQGFRFNPNRTNSNLKQYKYFFVYFSSIDKVLVWNNTSRFREQLYANSNAVLSAINSGSTYVVKSREYPGRGSEIVRVLSVEELSEFIRNDI